MTTGAPLELVRDVGARSATSPTGALPYTRADALAAPEAEDEIVEGVLARSAFAVAYGPSGCGKTFLAVHLAACIASEREFLGRRTRRRAVIYFAPEAGRSAGNRLIAWRNEFISGAAEVELPVSLVTCALDLRTELSPDVDAVIETIRETGAGVAVLDTFNAAFAGGDENSSVDMGSAVANLRRVVDETGVALLVVHHAGKVAGNGLRGHSLFQAAADAVVEVSNSDGTVTAKVVKHRDAPIGDELHARLRRVELGVSDSWGRALTSCVMEDATPPRPSRVPAKLPKGASVALQALQDAISEHGQTMPGTSGIPPGKRAVAMSKWRDRFYIVTPLDSDAPEDREKASDARLKRFNRAREALQEAGVIGVCNVWVWLN